MILLVSNGTRRYRHKKGLLTTCDQPLYHDISIKYGINNNALSSYMALGGAHQGCSR